MLSQTGLFVFFMVAYIWFCIGFVLIAFPAIKELTIMFSKKNKKGVEEAK